MPMPEEFDAVNKLVVRNFGVDEIKDFGKLTLDYNQKKIRIDILKDMNEKKKYFGHLDIGTFANRAFFKDYVTSNHIVTFKTASGKTFENPITVSYDLLLQDRNREDAELAYPEAKKLDFANREITWSAVVNKAKNQMEDPYVYLSPYEITEMTASSDNGETVTSNGMKFAEGTQANYTLDWDSVEVYKATKVDDSMHYELGEKLTDGVDYVLSGSSFDPTLKDDAEFQAEYKRLNDEWEAADGNRPRQDEIDKQIDQLLKQKSKIAVVRFEGKYKNTNDTFVIIHKGKNDKASGQQDRVTFDVGVMYTSGDSVLAKAATTDIFLNDSTGHTIGTNDPKGTVIVVHIDDDEGTLIIPEEIDSYNKAVGEPYSVVEGTSENYQGYQDKEYKNDKAEENKKAFEGYRFTGLGFDSAAKDGHVKEGVQRVYLYYTAIKGSVKVIHIDQATGKPITDKTGAEVEEAKLKFVTDDNGDIDNRKLVDTVNYTTEKLSEEKLNEHGYEFVNMGYGSAEATGEVTEGEKTVIYVYKKKTEPEECKQNGTVKIVYSYDDGTPTEEKDLENMVDVEVGTKYKVTPDEKEGYTRVLLSGTEEGDVKPGENKVVYLYKKVVEAPKGKVIIEYRNSLTGELIKKTEDPDKDKGSEYTVSVENEITENGKNYEKVYSPEKITVNEGDNIVTVMYKEKVEEPTPEAKKGFVKVVHVYEDSTTEVEYLDENGQDVGTKYETHAKPKKEGFEEGVVKTNNASGEVAEKETTVVYFYAKTPAVPGQPEKKQVTIVYVNQKGETIKEKTVEGNVREVINLENEETDQKGDKTYKLIANQEDKTVVTSGDNKVVIVYMNETPETPEPADGSVTVKYIDTEGNELGSKKVEGKVGQESDINADETINKDDSTYNKIAGQEDKVVITENGKEVIIVYKKQETQPEAPKGKVIIEYRDTDGKLIKEETVAENQDKDSDYNVNVNDELEEGGKTYSKVYAPEKVTVKEGDNRVVVLYKEKVTDPEQPQPETKKGFVKVVHVYEGGETVVEYVNDEGQNVGEDYTTQAKEKKEGYEDGVVKTGNATGKVAEKETTVVYYYAKTPETPEPTVPENGKVIVKFIDTEGNELEKKEITGKIGEESNIDSQETITKGEAVYDRLPGQEDKVVITNNAKEVIIVYRKQEKPVTPVDPEAPKGKVIIEYRDTNGALIKEETAAEDQDKDSKYKVNVDETINEGGKEYTKVYAPNEVVVKEGDNKVIVLYKEKVTEPEQPQPETKKGFVKVVHVYEGGETVVEYVDEAGQDVGTDYTTQAKPKKEGYEEGVVKTNNATGKVAEKETTVVYYYAKTAGTEPVDPEKPGKTTIIYIDNNGNEIQRTDVEGNGTEKTVENTIEKDGKTYEKVYGEDKVTVVPGENKVIVVYREKVTEPTPEDKTGKITIVYLNNKGEKLQEDKVIENQKVNTEYVFTEEEKNLNENVADKDKYTKVYGEDKVVVREGDNKVIFLYNKPEECVQPEKPETTDNGTQTDPKEPGTDGGTQTDPENPGTETPEKPGKPEKPVIVIPEIPGVPSRPGNENPPANEEPKTGKELPNTGVGAIGGYGILSAIALAGAVVNRRRRNK